MPFRASLLFDVTTDPVDRQAASAHSGGWSESHWVPSDTGLATLKIPRLAVRRARILATQASIIGYRIEQFTISGNKLLPGGTSGGRFLYPGDEGSPLNLPQDALSMNAVGAGVVNSTRFNLRGLPDDVITRGEYQPPRDFSDGVDGFAAQLVRDGWGFIGRVKTNPSARVLSVTNGVFLLSGAIGGTANVDFIRLNRVYDNNGLPVKGTFLITAISGNSYTVASLATLNISKPSGTARIDALSFFQYTTVNPQRAVSRKIGRPFEQYRGRRSKTRA